MLGTLITRLSEPGKAEEALLAAGDLPLVAALGETAERLNLSPGSFAALAVRRFVEQAGDEDWLQLSAIMGRAEDPAGAALRAILHRAVADAREVA